MNIKFGLSYLVITALALLTHNDASAVSVPVKACSDVIEFNGEAYFCADHRENGKEIFRSNGEPEGTLLLRDIDPGPGDSSPSGFFTLNGFLYFTAENTLSGFSLWRTDGTPENTIRISRLAADFAGGATVVAEDSERVFFQTGSDQLYVSDGTADGTRLLNANVTSGFAGLSFGVASSYFLDRESLLFVTNSQLYRLRITDNVVSEIFTFPRNGSSCGFDTAIDETASIPGRLVLYHTRNPCGDDTGQSVWISDYSRAGTLELEPSNVRVLASFDTGSLMCSLTDSAYFSLTSSGLVTLQAGFDDGTFCERSLVEHVHNGVVYFYQFSARELWFKDLSTQAPQRIESALVDQSVRRAYENIGNDLYVIAELVDGDSALLQLDGSTREFIQLSEFSDQRLVGLHRINSQLYFLFNGFVSDPLSDIGIRFDLTLWRFQQDGSTKLVRRIEGEGENDRVQLWNEGNRLYFQLFVDGDLWHSNGTSESTYRLTYLVPDSDGSPEQGDAAGSMQGVYFLLMDDEEPRLPKLLSRDVVCWSVEGRRLLTICLRFEMFAKS